MPIYEYSPVSPDASCYHCRGGFEVLQPLSEEPLAVCPACGKPVRRVISAPSIGASESGFDDRAKSAGFTKLRKIGKGEYEKEY